MSLCSGLVCNIQVKVAGVVQQKKDLKHNFRYVSGKARGKCFYARSHFTKKSIIKELQNKKSESRIEIIDKAVTVHKNK